MSMNYFIYPDKETKCKHDFPNGLSFFFEQVGGYGEHSEVSQVSKILNIDLSIFQHYDSSRPENEKYDDREFWNDIDTFINVIDLFVNKIQENKDYYKSVQYNPNQIKYDNQLENIWKIKDTTVRNKELDNLYKQPGFLCPLDYGYLKNGEILIDLNDLKQVFECLKKEGIKRIKLMYM